MIESYWYDQNYLVDFTRSWFILGPICYAKLNFNVFFIEKCQIKDIIIPYIMKPFFTYHLIYFVTHILFSFWLLQWCTMVFYYAKMQNCHFYISHHTMATNRPIVIYFHFMNPEHIRQMLRSFILFSIIQILSYWPLNITTCPKM